MKERAAQFAAIRTFRALLEGTGNGLIVNVSSISDTMGIGSNIAYCAAKAGLDVMAVALGRALAPRRTSRRDSLRGPDALLLR